MGGAGTDHGTSGPVFLAGTHVQSGLIGSYPSLTDLVDGDLKMTVDFRRVYATVLEDWLGLASEKALDGTFEQCRSSGRPVRNKTSRLDPPRKTSRSPSARATATSPWSRIRRPAGWALLTTGKAGRRAEAVLEAASAQWGEDRGGGHGNIGGLPGGRQIKLGTNRGHRLPVRSGVRTLITL